MCLTCKEFLPSTSTWCLAKPCAPFPCLICPSVASTIHTVVPLVASSSSRRRFSSHDTVLRNNIDAPALSRKTESSVSLSLPLRLMISLLSWTTCRSRCGPGCDDKYNQSMILVIPFSGCSRAPLMNPLDMTKARSVYCAEATLESSLPTRTSKPASSEPDVSVST